MELMKIVYSFFLNLLFLKFRMANYEELEAVEFDANCVERARNRRRDPRWTHHRRHTQDLHQKVHPVSFQSSHLVFVLFLPCSKWKWEWAGGGGGGANEEEKEEEEEETEKEN